MKIRYLFIISVFILFIFNFEKIYSQTPSKKYSNIPIDVNTADRPVAYATKTTEKIIIDGDFNEGAWSTSDTITNFIQAVLKEGYPATEQTLVRLLYDENNIYISAICYDSEPDKLVIESLNQDFETHNSDVFAVTFDTFFDRSNAFMFLFNPMGAIKDGQVFNDSRNPNLAWEGVIEVKTKTHQEGWNIEIAIPFSTLRFNSSIDDQKWGMNFLRRVRRKNEDSYWSPLPRRGRVHKMSKAGTLLGIRGIKSGKNLNIKPFTSFSKTSSSKSDFGGDVKWGITPSLTLDLTINTDFSQVESDKQQVNLDRFPLFFPEKRDFFIENAGLFTFGDISERNYRMGSSLKKFSLFHSRRIGLDSGNPVPINGGGRLTGKFGKYELGLIGISSRGDIQTPDENFNVFRLRRSLFGNSDMGLMYINRASDFDGNIYKNNSYGVDANLKFFKNLVVSSYYAASDDTLSKKDNYVSRLSVGWRGDIWDISGFYKKVGKNFNPGVGFINRKGVNHAYATIGGHPPVFYGKLFKLNPYIESHYVTDNSSSLVTQTNVASINFHFKDGSLFGIKGVSRFEVVRTPFSVGKDLQVLAGNYNFSEFVVSYRSNASLPFFANINLFNGSYFAGRKKTIALNLAVRAGYKLTSELTSSYNEITYSGQKVYANLYGLKVKYSYSTNLHALLYYQFNAITNESSTNIRFNFMHSPLSDLFIIFSERRIGIDGDQIDQGIAIKFTKLFSL
jgi:hypothetical protein